MEKIQMADILLSAYRHIAKADRNCREYVRKVYHSIPDATCDKDDKAKLAAIILADGSLCNEEAISLLNGRLSQLEKNCKDKKLDSFSSEAYAFDIKQYKIMIDVLEKYVK